MCRRSRARGIVETCVCDRYGRNPTQHRPKKSRFWTREFPSVAKKNIVHMLYIYIYIIETRLNKSYLTSKNKIKRTTVPHSPILSKLQVHHWMLERRSNVNKG